MCVRELIVVLIWISFLETGVQACPHRCVCADGVTCSECQMWYIFKVEGGVANCDSYIANVHFAQRPDLSASTVGADKLTVIFLRQDLSISTDALDYYYYLLQWRQSGSHSSYENTGTFVKHYNSGNPTSIQLTSGELKARTAYELRVALYKRVALRGWEQLTDYTNSVTMTTAALSWVRKGGYEYMISHDNALSDKNFEDASAYCQLQGSHLASVTSLEENQFLADEARTYTWIGFHIPEEIGDVSDCNYCDDCNREEDKESSVYCTRCVSCRALWHWTDGSEVTYTFWVSSHPYTTSYRCVAIYQYNDYWYQRNCFSTDDFVCKREQETTAPSTCGDNCECDSYNQCTACKKWYIYSTSGNDGRCADYLEKVTLPTSVNVSQDTASSTSLSVSFKRLDLSIPMYGTNYYYYDLQYKLVGETDDSYQNSGSFQQHHNSGNPVWITFSVSGLPAHTEYSVRIALYRRVVFRGWLDVSDTTESVVMTTGAHGWITFGEYEYMYSSRNSLPQMTFSEASTFCQTRDSSLTSILTYDENQFIRSYIYTYTWIGFHVPDGVEPTGCSSCDNCYYASNKNESEYCTQCIHCRSLWRWTDDSPVGSTFWDEDEPNNNYECAMTYYGEWYDGDCGGSRYFICKRKAAALTDSTGDGDCPANCLCEEGGECAGCSMWHVYRIVEGQGNCEIQIDKVQFPNRMKPVVSEIEETSATVRLPVPALVVPAETLDYYSYSLQYKLSSQPGEKYTNTGEFVHHYPEQDWVHLSMSTFLPGTSYTVRVALYRRFDLKGWLELLDVTDPVAFTTLSPNWKIFGDYEYMFSAENDLQQMDFASSKEACRQNGAELVTVLNAFESEFISRNSTNKQCFWIGLHLPDTAGTDGCDTCSNCHTAQNKNTSRDCVLCHQCRTKWVWTNGDPVQYTFWHEQEPNQKARCACMLNNQWFDQLCSANLNFICKRESTGAGRTVPRTTASVGGESAGAVESDPANSEGNQASVIGAVAGLVGVLIIVVVVAVIVLALFLRKASLSGSKQSPDVRPPLELDSIQPQVDGASNPYEGDCGNNNTHKNPHQTPPQKDVYENQHMTYENLQVRHKEGPSVYEPVRR